MFNKLEEIRAAKGKEKLEIMKGYPELKRIFLYTYDKFRKFGINQEKLETFFK